eukprot:CAMPEP_0194726754 /NCGR_PEP_ID=MMETSP0296-20130528/31667_1 /TAXON_ID=39354 /ORGANISM="Heterosigma akashiwo, Strain CCMP2393" /LENGTH=300 /DNA_ID=CAMNT_0039631841 /DNA_START=42 /DNA_END=944 /DNA_ORIENTATION=+
MAMSNGGSHIMVNERQNVGSVLVIFDHDNSLTNMDSGLHTVGALAPNLNDNFKRYMDSGIGWTKTMDNQMGHLHEQGFSKEEVLAAAARTPVQPGVVEAVKAAAGAAFWIVSDGNAVFIDAFIKFHELEEAFSVIHTNKAEWDEDGRLRVSPYHSNESCRLCPSNLCKGRVLDGLLTEEVLARYTQIVYVGDGKGDFCPATRLRPQDVLLCRNGGPRQFELIKWVRRMWQEHEQTPPGQEEGGPVAEAAEGEEEGPLPPVRAAIVQWDSGHELAAALGRACRGEGLAGPAAAVGGNAPGS